MQLPRTANLVPMVNKLRQSLNYGSDRKPLATAFCKQTHAFRELYRTASGLHGSDLVIWNSEEHVDALVLMTKEFLHGSSNGVRFWPDDDDLPESSDLKYSQHADRIEGLLVQLFFRLNQQQYRNDKYRHKKSRNSEPAASARSRRTSTATMDRDQTERLVHRPGTQHQEAAGPRVEVDSVSRRVQSDLATSDVYIVSGSPVELSRSALPTAEEPEAAGTATGTKRPCKRAAHPSKRQKKSARWQNPPSAEAYAFRNSPRTKKPRTVPGLATQQEVDEALRLLQRDPSPSEMQQAEPLPGMAESTADVDGIGGHPATTYQAPSVGTPRPGGMLRSREPSIGQEFLQEPPAGRSDPAADWMPGVPDYLGPVEGQTAGSGFDVARTTDSRVTGASLQQPNAPVAQMSVEDEPCTRGNCYVGRTEQRQTEHQEEMNAQGIREPSPLAGPTNISLAPEHEAVQQQQEAGRVVTPDKRHQESPAQHQSGQHQTDFIFSVVFTRYPNFRVRRWLPQGKFLKKTLAEVREELPPGFGDGRPGLKFGLKGPVVSTEDVVLHGQEGDFHVMKVKFGKDIRKNMDEYAGEGPLTINIRIEELGHDYLQEENLDVELTLC